MRPLLFPTMAWLAPAATVALAHQAAADADALGARFPPDDLSASSNKSLVTCLSLGPHLAGEKFFPATSSLQNPESLNIMPSLASSSMLRNEFPEPGKFLRDSFRGWCSCPQ